MLFRHFVGKRLGAYYAQASDSVVGSIEQSRIPFMSLLGEYHWKRLYRRLYDENKGQWLTPVELFKPHYSNILGDYVIERFGSILHFSSGLEIVELGGGRATNAVIVLDYLREKRPDIYEVVTYRIIDSSPSLHQLQKDIIATTDHAERVVCQLKDALDVAEGKFDFVGDSPAPTVLLCLEILDNLPHDKIRIRSGNLIDEARIRWPSGEEDLAVQLAQEDVEEIFTPLSDSLIRKVIQTSPLYSRSQYMWIPTVACGLLSKFLKERPNSSVLLADFDYLPAPDQLTGEGSIERLSVRAEGEPLVTSMDCVDFECLLRAPPNCDILFPTDFQKLASFLSNVQKPHRRKVNVYKQADFLLFQNFEEVQKTRSWISGYSPMIHDFGNCSVLTLHDD